MNTILSSGRLLSAIAARRYVKSNFSVHIRYQSTSSSSSSSSSSVLSNTAKSKIAKERRQERKKALGQLLRLRNPSLPTFHLDEALRIIRATANASSFDSTVDLQVQLGIDPRKTNQAVRGVAALPHGTGRRVIVAVFARGEKAEEARQAGAQFVGAEDLVEKVSKGEIGFTRAIATPDVMPLVGKVARVLGPRGLMPNPKLGTVTINVRDAVLAAKRGQAEFRSEKRGIVSSAVGKSSFSPDELRENVKALLLALYDSRPEGFKGSFVRAAFLSSTHGQGIPLSLAVVDPANASFMSSWDGRPVLA
jgi:large subunit ribosomal protein L1